MRMNKFQARVGMSMQSTCYRIPVIYALASENLDKKTLTSLTQKALFYDVQK